MKFEFKRLFAFLLTIAMIVPLLPTVSLPTLAAASGTHTPVTGVTVGVSGATDNSMSSGAVTVTAKGSGGLFGLGASAKTATITITNDSGSKATVSFDWTATSVNQLVIDGTTVSGTSGSKSKVLDAGASFTITITTAKNSTVNKLVMNNFACINADAEKNITFQFDSSLGSVTVDGSAVSNNQVKSIKASGATLKATPNSGKIFFGWIDVSTSNVISKDVSYTLQPKADMTIKAWFTEGEALFSVNKVVYPDLSTANDVAKNGTVKTIVLENNGVLPSGNYEISSGVTLLIPYDAANTLCTTKPTEKKNNNNDYVQPVFFRTLTMASGAHITVNGAISVSGMHHAAQPNAGVPTDAVGRISMQSNSTITVNNGAKLYVWGYITGSGAVTVKSGGTVYEDFQVTCWRGGTATSSMVDNTNKVFPMTQYYIQNVEVPMTLEAGAIENGYMSVTVTLIGVTGSEVPFIGPEGMFQIDSGSVTKDYNESADRLDITVNGESTVMQVVKTNSWGDPNYAVAAYVVADFVEGENTVAVSGDPVPFKPERTDAPPITKIVMTPFED